MSMAAAIDRLIEPSSSGGRGMEKDPSKEPLRPLYRYHSYTPASSSAAPRSPSPSSFSPSPYVINFKGRRPAVQLPLDKGSSSKFRDPGPSEQQVTVSQKPASLESRFEASRNGFYQDDVVSKSLNDKHAGDEKKVAEPATPIYSRMQSSGFGEEFFDANESPLEETSSQSEMNVEEEEEEDPAEQQQRCRNAEEALEIVLQKLAAGGLALPPTLLLDKGGKAQVEEVRERVEDLDIAGQLMIKRMVEAAVARGAARAEVEESLEAELESKSREVTRLRDKVRYNELVNREMSQRNQEAIEMARNKRRARQRKFRWALASASAAVAVGVSAALVYKYGPWQDVQPWKTSSEASKKA